MINPPTSSQDPGSYMDLLNRMTKNVQGAKVDARILQMLRESFDAELGKQHIVLARPEIERLFNQVAKAVLADILATLDGAR